MKPQDIVIATKIVLIGEFRISYAELAKSLEISTSETHACIRRLKDCYLFDSLTNTIRYDAFEEFIIHGLKYAFPAFVGKNARGIATATSSPFIEDEFSVRKIKERLVWPFSKGTDRGSSIEPLYRTIPNLCLSDRQLYYWFSLFDIFRLNKAREREVAIKHFRNLIKEPK